MIAAVTVLGLVLFLILSDVTPIGRFPVTLVGMTNDPTQGRLASFIVTNASGATIDYCNYPPQVMSNGVWSPLQRPAHGSLGPLHELTLGKVNWFSVIVPTNAVEWRVPVGWGCRPTTALQGIIGRIRSNLHLNWYLLRHGKPLKYNSGVEVNLFMSYSAAITNRG
jgi:hypothetical protein